MSDTIYAVASGAGRSAIALIRVSGPRAIEMIGALTCCTFKNRVSTYCTLRHPDTRKVLDKALATVFAAPASYTGEDLLELSLHGGVAIIRGVLDTLNEQGLRPALPGEFTRRAFENGKLDLTEAEAVADLVDAETDTQRDQAFLQLAGGLSRRAEDWRAILIEAAARLEAEIDFPDDDLPVDVTHRVLPLIQQLRDEFAELLADHRGEQVREGFRIALLGAPNAGKSSVMNGLLGRDAVIVTDVPGTTRDVVEAALEIEGYRVVLADMAGLRSTDDLVEKEGVRRALAWASSAALRLLIVDQSLNDADWRSGLDLMTDGDIVVLNKSDRPLGVSGQEVFGWAVTQGYASVHSQADVGRLDQLRQAITTRVQSALAGIEHVGITRHRHRVLVAEAVSHLDRALASRRGAEVLAEDIRLTGRALGRLVGRVDTEHVLDHVFSSFCIGK